MNRFVCLLTLGAALIVPGVGMAQQSAVVSPKTSAYETELKSFLSKAQSADAKSSDADFIVAMVNNDIVTQNDVKARWAAVQKAYPGGQIPAAERTEILYRLVDDLVTERLHAQAAKLAGVVVDKAAVENTIASIAKQNDLSVAQLIERLPSEGLTHEEFRGRIASQMLAQKVRDRFTDTRPFIAEQAIEAEMSRLQKNLVPAEWQANLAHLLFAVPEDATASQEQAVRAKAQNAADRAKSGVDFGELGALLDNRAPKTDAKGMGLKDLNKYPGLFADAVAQLPVGGVSDPVKSGAGYHVLKVLEKKESPVILITVTETRARHILLRTNSPAEVEQATAELAALRDEIVGGKTTFAQAAKTVSHDGSGQVGGDLGWAMPGLYVPEFEKPMMQLPIGQVSAPVVSRFGVHLIEVIERRDARMPRSVLRDRVLGHLREAKSQESFKTWNQELRDRAYIEWREAPRL